MIDTGPQPLEARTRTLTDELLQEVASLSKFACDVSELVNSRIVSLVGYNKDDCAPTEQKVSKESDCMIGCALTELSQARARLCAIREAIQRI